MIVYKATFSGCEKQVREGACGQQSLEMGKYVCDLSGGVKCSGFEVWEAGI